MRIRKIRNRCHYNTLGYLILGFYLFTVIGISNAIAAEHEDAVNLKAQLAWAEPVGEDYKIFYSSLRNNLWTPKVQLSNSNFTDLFPSISSGVDGITWVVWTGLSGSKSHLFYCNFDGSSWSNPKKILTNLSSNTSSSIIVDNDNIPWVVWAGYDGEDDDIWFTRWNGDDWDEPQRVNKDDSMPDILPVIGIDGEGNPWVCWLGYDGGTYKKYFSRWDETGWDEEIKSGDIHSYTSMIMDERSPIPDLPDFLYELDKASIHITNGGQIQSIPLHDLTNMSKSSEDSNIYLNQINKSSNQVSNEEIIIGFGDSITQGHPYVTEDGDGGRVGGYEPKLEELLDSVSRPSEVYNHGDGGEMTIEGIYRIDDVIDSYDHVDYILILEGINDYGILSSSTTIFNLGVMIDRSLNRYVEPVLATLTPDSLYESRGNFISTVLNPAIKDLADEKEISLCDQYNAVVDNWSSLTSDGFHPNDIGYGVMAQTWFYSLSKPVATTLAGSTIRETTVTLNGLVNPHGHATSYYFEYGTTEEYGTTTASMDAGSGNSEISVSADLTGLTGETTYRFRLVTTNSYGKSYGSDITFKTTDGTVVTLEVSQIGVWTATLNGLVNPKGDATSYYFEYGTTEEYGTTTASMDAGSGNSEISVSADLTGLTPYTTYYFRLVVTRNPDSSYGGNMTFQTYEESGSNGSGGGCFVATAAFGSSLEPHVMILKDFRDQYLLTNRWGREFVEFYYKISPQIADIIADYKPLKLIVRTSLYPIVGYSYLMVNSSAGEKIALFCFFILIMICFGVLWLRLDGKVRFITKRITTFSIDRRLKT